MADDILDFESKKKKKAKPLVHDFKDETDNLANQDILDFGSKKKKKDKLLSLDDVGNKEDEPEFHEKDPTENGVKQLTEKLADELNFSDKKKKRKFKPIEVDENGVCELNNTSELIVRDSSGYDYETFNWPAAPATSTSLSCIPWPVTTDPPNEAEIRKELQLLKRYKSPGPDDLPPALFKDGGDFLVKELITLFTKV